MCAYWFFSFVRIGPLQLLFIWFPLYLCAALPHLIENECASVLVIAPLLRLFAFEGVGVVGGVGRVVAG